MKMHRFLAFALATAAPTALLAAGAGCAGTASGGVYTPTVAGTVVVDESPPAPRETVVYHRSGQVWVTGRWVRDDGEWRWRRGHWVSARPDYVYVQGYWDYNNGRYVYRDGHWIRRRHDQRWVEGRWVTNANGRMAWRSGYWAPAPARAEYRARPAPRPRPAPVAVPSDGEWRRRQDVREREFDRSQLLREREFERDLRRKDLTPGERADARRRFENQQKRREDHFASQQLKREKRHGQAKRREARNDLRN